MSDGATISAPAAACEVACRTRASTAIASVVVASHFGPTWATPAALVLTWFLIALTLIDLDHKLLPDSLTLPLLWIGLLIALIVLLHTLFRGKRSHANPWGGATLEWHCTSPPPYYNFDRAPAVGDPYDVSDLYWNDENERYVIAEPEREIAPAKQPETAPAHAEHDH